MIELLDTAVRRQAAMAAQDIRQAWRSMRKSPGFTAAAIAMLALGTGVNAAMFSVVDGVMLRSPFDRPDAIAWVGAREPNGRTMMAVPREAFESFRQLPLFSAAAVVRIGAPVADRIPVPRRLQAECVPAPMFEVLRPRLHLGRWFSAQEDRPGGPPVAVVSFRFWRQDLGSDPDVLGRTLALDGEVASIIGVTSSGFDGARSLPNRDLWVPLGQSTPARPRYGCRLGGDLVNAVVRLRPGLPADEATRQLNAAMASRLDPDGPPLQLTLLPLDDIVFGDLRRPFIALAGAVLAVLLIACANVANLGLERLAGRRREVAVRQALGASRGRIARQWVTEHLVLAVLGGAAGLLLARLTLGALVALLPAWMPHLDQVGLNSRVLAASIGLALVAGFGVGLVPALRSGGGSLRDDLGSGGRGRRRSSGLVSRVLVVTELAFGTLLLVGALLMIQTFVTLRPSSPGFDPDRKTIALASLPEDLTLEARQRFFTDVARELTSVPGVRAVAGTTYVPMSRRVDVLGMTVGETAGRVFAGAVSPGYFELLRVPVVRGRGLSESNVPGSPAVAVVNEAFVRRWLPGREPIGAIVGLDLGGRTATLHVAGVIRDFRSWGGDTRPRPELYVPFGQMMFGSPSFVVETDAKTAARLPGELRAIVSRVRPGQLVDSVDRFEDLVAAEVAQPRFGAWLLGLLAALAVTLSGLGLAATLAWSVAERRREIGVRLALGAPPRHIQTRVLGRAALMSGFGIALGLSLAALSTRLLQSWLYEVTPLDGPTFVACGAFMAVVSLAASYVPARRATRVDPLVAMRAE